MAKGDDRERQAANILQRAGYATYRPATVRFGENDMFGLFDILAVAPDMEPRAIQVKSNRAVGLKDWKRHTHLFRQLGFATEYWVCVDTEGWKVYDAGQAPSDGRRAARVVYSEPDDEQVTKHRGTELNLTEGVQRWLENE